MMCTASSVDRPLTSPTMRIAPSPPEPGMHDNLDRTIIVLVCLAAMGAAIVGGMFYAFSSFVMRALGRIAPEQGVAAMKSINVVVITPSFMVVFAGTAVLCLVLAGASTLW